jgi:hypothetical protein
MVRSACWRRLALGLNGLLNLLEGAHLDLAHALAADANSPESSSSVIGSSARRRASKMRRSRSLSTSSASRMARRCRALLLDQHVSWLALSSTSQSCHSPDRPRRADRRVERGVARQAAVHVDHVLLGDAEAGGDLLDLLGLEIAFVQRLDLALGLAQVEEQLLLVGGGAHLHEAPRAQDVFLDRGLDPPHGIGGEAEAALGLELLHGLHQADIAFGDDLADRQAVAAIAHGDLGHEPQMAGDELVRRVGIAMLAPALGEHVLFLRLQHGKAPDFFQIAGQPAFAGNKCSVQFSRDFIPNGAAPARVPRNRPAAGPVSKRMSAARWPG